MKQIKSTLIHYDGSLLDRKMRLPLRADGSKWTWPALLELGVSAAERLD